jgi:hypothetical protein
VFETIARVGLDPGEFRWGVNGEATTLRLEGVGALLRLGAGTPESCLLLLKVDPTMPNETLGAAWSALDDFLREVQQRRASSICPQTVDFVWTAV